MAAFSSRGPNPSFDVLKPDLAAPGWEILGAVSSTLIFGFTGDEYLTVSGTSMASPHVAGAAALLLALHPGWSPAEVKSALMTTAATSLVKEDGLTAADPFDGGGGRPELGRAARAGLVFPETAAAYAAADPALGGQPETLNVPALVASHCDAGCAFQRTVKTVLAAPAQWTATVSAPPGMTIAVTPPLFSLDASSPLRTLDVTVTLDEGFPFGDWAFGEIVLVPDDVSVPETRLPVAAFALGLEIFSDGFESGNTLAWSVSVP